MQYCGRLSGKVGRKTVFWVLVCSEKENIEPDVTNVSSAGLTLHVSPQPRGLAV